MFYCKRCGYEHPDNTESCPICGTVNMKLYKKQVAPIKFLIHFSDILALAMSFANLFVLLTCSHYCLNYEHGLLVARLAYYEYFPALLPIEIIFCIILLSIPILSIIARKKMMKRQRTGVRLIIGTYIGLVLWTIIFPLSTLLATSIFTPVFAFWITQISVFTALAVTVSILLLNYDGFLF